MTAAADFPAAAAAVDAAERAELDRLAEHVAERVAEGVAERVAELVLAELRQGTASTSLPAWVGELLAEWSKSGQTYQRTPILYPTNGAGYVELEARLVDGRLALALWINGGRVWDVTLGGDRA